MYTTKTRFYRTEAGDVVPEGNPKARFLLYRIGQEITNDEAIRIGALPKPSPSMELETAVVNPVSKESPNKAAPRRSRK